jgi:hypothetical protein
MLDTIEAEAGFWGDATIQALMDLTGYKRKRVRATILANQSMLLPTTGRRAVRLRPLNTLRPAAGAIPRSYADIWVE